ncbi:PREDICTED: protein LURP-one-related 6-like [Tarenaya hassleriana]|uniref:protein LURP-one-related 6-like n=1 Tax=Tarenaya hassleriana TaxID=28532 RepID=UPI00053C1A6C|nr:PREDICTED: protein LURP-one-related 6-like [Tarenaya hassleriana]
METKYNNFKKSSSGKMVIMKPVVSKLYCSAAEAGMLVRRRPHAVNGGGFVVTDCKQNVVFRIDGCGVLGARGELVLRDGDGDELLLIQRKGGIVQALSIHNKWRGYSYNFQGYQKPVFTLRDPKTSCFPKTGSIRISIEPCSTDNCFFEIRGYFPDRSCSIIDSAGNTIAQIGVSEEVKELKASGDFYHVIIKPGVDKAFIFGVIAVLDYIYGESTRC